MRLRRSLLFVSGSLPEQMAEAPATGADGVILDLEDTVAPAQKAEARGWVVAALRRVDFRGRERIVRVNPLGSPDGDADLAAVVGAAPDALVLPKVRSVEEIARADREVTRLEREAGLDPGRIRLHPLVETVAGVVDVQAIGRGSRRNAALLFGAGDLTRETRGRLVPSRAPELYALSRLLLAARATGLDAIDTPYFDLADVAGLEAHARVTAELGYDGKAVIHLRHVGIVNRLFTPSPESVSRARRIVELYEQAEMAGTGTLTLDGQFIDAVHVLAARETLERARLAGVA